MNQIVKFSIKYWIYLIISCVLIQIFNLFLAVVFEDRNSSSYFLSIIDKHNNFKKNKEEQNIIIIGGSSNAFGINSSLIESLTGLNIMNFGVHGDLGIEFYISEAKLEAKSNDIILANIEYELTGENAVYGNPELYQAIFESKGQILKYGNISHILNTYFFGGMILRNNILSYLNTPIPKTHDVYYRSAFDSKGDLQSQSTYQNNNLRICNSSDNFQEINFNPSKNYIKRLLSLEKHCSQNNITLYISFPPIASSSFNSKKSELLYDMLNNEKINLINYPNDGVLCDTLFSGTNYHLTKFGRDIYSTQLAYQIKEALGRKNINNVK
jgi:hypothetical protein